MPIVRVEMWPGRTHSQKAELARAITEAMVTIAHTTPDQTFIVFEDVPKRTGPRAAPWPPTRRNSSA